MKELWLQLRMAQLIQCIVTGPHSPKTTMKTINSILGCGFTRENEIETENRKQNGTLVCDFLATISKNFQFILYNCTHRPSVAARIHRQHSGFIPLMRIVSCSLWRTIKTETMTTTTMMLSPFKIIEMTLLICISLGDYYCFGFMRARDF